MSDRHDSLVTASKIVLFTEDVVGYFVTEDTVTSVGQFIV